MFSFEQLKVFVTIVQVGGFRAAADSLYRTQPAITAAVKQLEDRLGFELFDRSAYRPELTDKGQAFFEKALRIVNQSQDLQDFVEQINSGLEPEISIAIDIFCRLKNYLPVFNQLVHEYPKTHFHFYSESLSGAVERLVEGEVDIAITENLVKNIAVDVLPLEVITLVPVATPDFIEYYQEQLFNPMRINECVQVVIRDSSRKSNISFGVNEHAHHWTVAGAYAKKNVICEGMGWGRLPKHLVQRELDNGDLEILKGENFDERYLQLAAIRQQKQYHGPVAQAIWEALTQLRMD